MTNLEKRILIVDDDDAIRALLFTVLRRRGYAVDAARHGREATERLLRCNYAVMLLDLMMPMMNGWEVLEFLEQVPRERRPLVVVLTAGPEPRDLDAEIVAGTLRKPFDIQLVIDMVSACVASTGGRMQPDSCPAADSTKRGGSTPDRVN